MSQNLPNHDLIALLERHLSDARAGRIVGVAVIAITDAGQINLHSVGDVCALHVGASQMQRQLLDAVFAPATSSPPMHRTRMLSS